MFGAVDQAYTHYRTKGVPRAILDKPVGPVGQLPAEPRTHGAPPALTHARAYRLLYKGKYVKRVNSPRLKKQIWILNEHLRVRRRIA